MNAMFSQMMNKVKKNWHWYDMSALKISVFVFALWLAKVWPAVLGLNTWVYALVWVVLFVYLLYKMFRK